MQVGEVRYKRAVATMHAKREAAAKPTAAARAITEDEQHTKLQLAAFVYALHQAIEKIPCFGFGRSLEAIADRVAMITSTGKFTAGDFSKLDATKATLSTLVFVGTMQQVLSAEDYARFVFIVLSFTGPVVTSPIVRVIYELFFQQGSGRMNTIVDNSCTTAFVAFCAYEVESGNAADEQSFDVAFARTINEGVYTGDDSGDHTDPKTLIRVGAELGFRIEAEACGPGHRMPANFLARIFPLMGSRESYADVVRMLAKMHLTTQTFADTAIARFMLLGEKSQAWLLSDSNTIVLGDIARAVARVFRELGLAMPTAPGWRAPGQWPNHVSKHEQYAYSTLEAHGFNFGEFKRWINRANSQPAELAMQTLLEPPTCVGPLAPNPLAGELFILDGEYFLGEGEPNVLIKEVLGGKIAPVEEQKPPPGAEALDAALVVSSEGSKVAAAYEAAEAAHDDGEDSEHDSDEDVDDKVGGTTSSSGVSVISDLEEMSDAPDPVVVHATAHRKLAAERVVDAFRTLGVKMRDAEGAVKKCFAAVTHGKDVTLWVEVRGGKKIVRAVTREEL